MAKLKYSLISTKSQGLKIIDDLKGGKHVNLRVFGAKELTSIDGRDKLFQYADSIKRISLFSMKISKKFFFNMAQRFPRITHLVLMNVEFTSAYTSEEIEDKSLPLQLLYLQHLEITDCILDFSPMELFDVPNVCLFSPVIYSC